MLSSFLLVGWTALIFSLFSCKEQHLRLSITFKNNELTDHSGFHRDAVIPADSNVSFAEGVALNCSTGRSLQFSGDRGSYVQMPPGPLNDMGILEFAMIFHFFVDKDTDFSGEQSRRALWIMRSDNSSKNTVARVMINEHDEIEAYQTGFDDRVTVGKCNGRKVHRGEWNWVTVQRLHFQSRVSYWYFYFNGIFACRGHKVPIYDFNNIAEGGHLMGGDSLADGFYGLKGRMTNIYSYSKQTRFRSITRHMNTPTCFGQESLVLHYPFNTTAESIVDESLSQHEDPEVGSDVMSDLVHNDKLYTMRFNGTSDAYILLPEHVMKGLNEFTIAFWVKVGNMSRDQDLVSKFAPYARRESSFKQEVSIRVESGNVAASIISLIKRERSGYQYYPAVTVPTTDFDNNSFNHITVILKHSNLSVFVNGTYSASLNLSVVFPMSHAHDDALVIGQRATNEHGHFQPGLEFEGHLADFRIYQYAINDTSFDLFRDEVATQPPFLPDPTPPPVTSPERQINSERITDQAWFAPVVTGAVVSVILAATAALVVFRRAAKARRLGTVLTHKTMDTSSVVNGSLAKLNGNAAKNSQWSELSRVEVERIDQVFFPVNAQRQ